MSERRIATQCEQCGQVDTDPKIHLGAVTKHHDCLSHSEEEVVRASGQVKDSGPKASAIIEAAKSGTRGQKLLDLILSGDLPQAEGLHEQNKES